MFSIEGYGNTPGKSSLGRGELVILLQLARHDKVFLATLQ
jgi:hypothetical protein